MSFSIVTPCVEVGEIVEGRKALGYTTPVLKVDKGRPMEMLHVELLPHGARTEAPVWELNDPVERQYDPTPILIQGLNSIVRPNTVGKYR